MVLLMVAVVLLGNCGWNSQVLVGAAYVILNGVYWVMGLVKPENFWYVFFHVLFAVPVFQRMAAIVIRGL